MRHTRSGSLVRSTRLFRSYPEAVERARVLAVGSLVLVALLALSGARPYDRVTWALEVLPIYVCIFAHAIVLMVGGAYKGSIDAG